MHILDVAKWNATDNEIMACKFITASHDDRFNTKSRLIKVVLLFLLDKKRWLSSTGR